MSDSNGLSSSDFLNWLPRKECPACKVTPGQWGHGCGEHGEEEELECVVICE